MKAFENVQMRPISQHMQYFIRTMSPLTVRTEHMRPVSLFRRFFGWALPVRKPPGAVLTATHAGSIAGLIRWATVSLPSANTSIPTRDIRVALERLSGKKAKMPADFQAIHIAGSLFSDVNSLASMIATAQCVYEPDTVGSKSLAKELHKIASMGCDFIPVIHL